MYDLLNIQIPIKLSILRDFALVSNAFLKILIVLLRKTLIHNTLWLFF